MNTKKQILVVGSSRGIGAEIVKYFSDLGHDVIGVSRSQSLGCEWIEADISTSSGITHLLYEIGQRPIDTLLFTGGTWEEYGFMKDFDFLKTSDEETRNIMSVNVIAPIEITKGLAKNLSLSSNPRAVYLGALSGLEHMVSVQVAYASSKFALRGAIQSLRVALKKEGIGFTVINPGNVATEEVLLDIEEGRFKEQTPIPISDIISAIEWILGVSSSVEVADINLIQK